MTVGKHGAVLVQDSFYFVGEATLVGELVKSTMSSSHPASNHQIQSESPVAAGSSSNRSFPTDTRKVSLDSTGQRRYSMDHGTLPPAGNQPPSGMGMMDMYIPSYEPLSPYNTGMPQHSNLLSMEYEQHTMGLSPQSQPLHHHNGSVEDRRYLPGMMDHLMQQGGSLYPRHMSMDSNPMQFPPVATTISSTGKRLTSVASATLSPRRSSTLGPYPLPPLLHLVLPKGDDKRSGVSSPLTSLSEEGHGMELQPEKKKPKKRAPPSTSFPIKLHKILANPDHNEYIDWLPHGRAFRILKAKGFEEHVLPTAFRSSRYSSFMRQINGWGFRRITEGPDLNAYFHEMFLRGLPDICAKMTRPGKGCFTANDFGECPDFYKISMLAPLPDPDFTSDSDQDDERYQGKKPRAEVRRPQAKKPRAKQTRRPQSRHSTGQTISTPGLTRSDSASSGMAVASPERAHTCLSSAEPSPSSDNNILLPFTPLSRELSLGDFGTSSGQESLSSWGSGRHQLSMFDQFETYRSSQVTPPGSSSFFPTPPTMESSSGGRPQQEARGLSVADLCYLTQQNRILLNQVNNHRTGNAP